MSQQNEFREIVGGFLLAIGLNIGAAIFFGLIASLFGSLQLFNIQILFLLLIFGIGLSQLIYIIPIVVRFSRRQQWGRMKGVIIAAVFTALLNGSCFLALPGVLKL
jgi:hypothetical protein